MARKIGDAFVRVHPDTQNFGKEAERGVEPSADRAGTSFGKRFSAAVAKAVNFRSVVSSNQTQLAKLDSVIGEHTEKVKALRTEIAKTGDVELFKNLGREQGTLRKLTALRDTFAKAGGESATGFGASFVQRVGPLLAKAPLGPAGAAIGATLALPAALGVSAAISGAVLGGAGIGGVVGGLILAKDDARAASAISALKSDIGLQLEEAAAPFVPAIVEATGIARAEFRAADGDLRRLFSSTSQYLAPLTRGFGQGAHRFLDGLADAAEKAGPVIDQVADGMVELGDAAGDAFRLLSDNAGEAASAVQALFTITEVGVRGTAAVINVLTEAYGFLDRGIAVLQGNTEKIALYAAADGEAAQKSNELAGGVDNANGAFQRQVEAAASAATANRTLTQSLDQVVDASRRVHDIHISAAEANLRYRDSLKAATSAADGHKRVSGEEEGALISLARSTNDLTAGLERSGKSTAELTKHSKDTRAEFIKVAEKMGYTSTQAKALADKYLAIPKGVNTKFTAPGLSGVKTIAGELYRTVQLLDGRVVDIKFSLGYGTSGALPFKAEGGPVRKGQPYVVGEKRPELFVPDTNGTIVPRVPEPMTWKSPKSGRDRSEAAEAARPAGPVRLHPRDIEALGEVMGRVVLAGVGAGSNSTALTAFRLGRGG